MTLPPVAGLRQLRRDEEFVAPHDPLRDLDGDGAADRLLGA